MSKVSPFEQPYSVTTRKSLGLPNRLGEHILGWSPLGYFNDKAGIYQSRAKPGGIGSQTIRERFYIPANPQSVAQQNWRDEFKAGMVAWANLTPEQKQAYNEKADPLGLHGVNLFLKEWLSS